jgi:hypothetical protein
MSEQKPEKEKKQKKGLRAKLAEAFTSPRNDVPGFLFFY